MPRKGYLTLKDAANELGVHPQTLRNWEAQGVIQLVRLPGSGYRRVPATEVERLQAQIAGVKVIPRRARIVRPPRMSAAENQKAMLLADKIALEVSATVGGLTLDDVMYSLRGRHWSP